MLNEVLVQNSGDIGGPSGDGNYSSPAAVPSGTIAFFPPGGSNSVDLSSNSLSDFDDLQVVLGTDDGPIVTNVIHPSETEVESAAYTAPRKQVDLLTPETLASDTRGVGFKVTSWDMNDQEPYDRQSYDVTVLSGDNDTDIIQKLAQAVQDLPVSHVNSEGEKQIYAAGNASVEFVPSDTANSGPGEITIDGITYDITWDTDKTTTVSNFINANESAIWANHGIRLSENSNNLVLTFVDNALGVGDVSHDDNAGSLTAGIDLTQNDTAATDLRIEAKNYGDTFETSAIGSWSPTISTDQTFREGTGSYEHVKDMEEYVHGFQGRYLVDDGILGRQGDLPTFAQTGNTYDLVIMRSDNDVDRSVNKQADPQEIYLALETSLTKTQINNFLGTSL